MGAHRDSDENTRLLLLFINNHGLRDVLNVGFANYGKFVRNLFHHFFFRMGAGGISFLFAWF